MGDRANVKVIDSDDKDKVIYLYTHYTGWSLPEQLRKALEFGKDRWDDPQYLTRVLISRLFNPDRDRTSGSGVSTFLGDGAGRIIELDIPNQNVSIGEKWWSFSEYISKERNWPK